jgi:hypothetical protein
MLDIHNAFRDLVASAIPADSTAIYYYKRVAPVGELRPWAKVAAQWTSFLFLGLMAALAFVSCSVTLLVFLGAPLLLFVAHLLSIVVSALLWVCMAPYLLTRWVDKEPPQPEQRSLQPKLASSGRDIYRP